MQKKLAYGGMSVALCVILLAMSCYLPTLKAATLFMASVIPYVVYRFSGGKIAFLVYVASAVLSFLLCQAGSPAIVAAYGVCFGNYPIFSAILTNKNFAFKIASKAVLYVIYFIAVYLIFTKILVLPLIYPPFLLFGGGMVVFALYDFLVYRTGEYLLNYLQIKNK